MISSSLVLFNNNPEQYELAIRSFIDGCDGVLYVVDNSEHPLCNELFNHPRVRYFHAGANIGFGKAHNFAVSKCADESSVHLILNPDISFGSDVISVLMNYLDDHPNVGVLMPRVNYPDGSLQRLCKLLPTPVDLIFRRFIPSRGLKDFINKRYEMHRLPQDIPSIVPSLSGCFLLVRTRLFMSVGGFDRRFFMYMEDVDLVRRLGDICETVYLPLVQVAHAYAKGSYRNPKLLAYHLWSAVLYFFKWGWIFDETRRERNRAAIEKLSKCGIASE